ncbi:hypothetical protein [Nocardia sp. NPDC050435]|uniref:hypothetical protein n=1 Tax=Nocardia sp. NPDC050435 TaxID=3155040 RepID=UPI0033C78F3D
MSIDSPERHTATVAPVPNGVTYEQFRSPRSAPTAHLPRCPHPGRSPSPKRYSPHSACPHRRVGGVLMQRIRSLPNKVRYTQVPNDAIDRLPDWNSIGLLAAIMRHSDDFEFDMQQLLRSKPGVGELATSRARTTLIQHGHLIQVKFRHDYRGWFCTDMFRAAEPHDADDIAELMDRYAPGSQLTITITDKNGRRVPKIVTIQWAEITSFEGKHVTVSDSWVLKGATHPTDSTKAQVEPSPGFPGLGDPGPGEPSPGSPGLGNPGVNKKTKKKTNEKTNKKTNEGNSPSVRSERASARETGQQDGRTDGGDLPGEQHAEGDQDDTATALVDAAGLRAHLVRIDMKPSQRVQLIDAVDRALLRFPADQVAAYLTDKARQAATVKFLLTALTEYADTIKDALVPFRREDFRSDADFHSALEQVRAAQAWLDAGAPTKTEPASTGSRPASAVAASVTAPSQPDPEQQPEVVVFAEATPAPSPASQRTREDIMAEIQAKYPKRVRSRSTWSKPAEAPSASLAVSGVQHP